jgi:protein ImuA
MQHDLLPSAVSARARRLRALIRPMEHSAERPLEHRTVSLGSAEFDAILPDNGLELGALHECVPAGYSDFAAALGFSLGLAARIVHARPGNVLWVFPDHCGFEQGRLHAPGLMAFGLDPNRFVEVGVRKTHAMLWVMEEGLAANGPGEGALAAVIGVEAGTRTGRDYDFTASRRLAMRAEKSGVTALLIRASAQTGIEGGAATAAATRWRVATEPHAPEPSAWRRHENPDAPRWAVSLVKSKRGMPGHRQVVEWDHETLSFHMAAALADRTSLHRSGEGIGGQASRPEWAAAS